MNGSRRRFVAMAGLAPFALVGARAIAAEPAAVCYDPAKLPLSQKSRRRALNYLEPSPDPVKRCAECGFFTPAASGCGTCQMLGGGQVSAGAVCNSFARKAA